MKAERISLKTYRMRDQTKAHMFDSIERLYNPERRHSRPGYLRLMDFERQARIA